MQYHEGGFRPGDPDIRPAVAAVRPDDCDADVLIIGCGPAGLTLAAYLAGFPEIRTRIVESKQGPLEKGQADGVSCRSMEMFQVFGFADAVKREAYRVNEATFWKPDPDDPARIIRTGRVQDVEDGLSEMPHVILNQARVHDMYLRVMRNAPTRLEPDYNRRFIELEQGGDGPVTVTLEHTETGARETLRARYVVGCDGARSAVRGAMGLTLEGDSAHQAWGVMDVLAVTDFPDIRFKSLIQSANEGSILVIPREGGYLVRFYVEMDKLSENERVASREITVDRLIAATNRILRPYAIDVRDVVWWSVYEIGHRLADCFDDGAPEPRVFIAGDACHTHSPKAGQGMNVSMGDAFNLGWKLVSVLSGRASPVLLRSYSEERQAVAQALIDFDHEWARIMSTRSGDGARMQEYFQEHGRYTAGLSVRYASSILTGEGRWQALAPGFPVGMRFHSAPVIRAADGKPMHLGHTRQADARWSLYAFAGGDGLAAQKARIAALCDWLSNDPASPIRRHTPPGADPDAVFDMRTVFQAHHHDLDASDLPALLHPLKGALGLCDYEKVFCPDLKSGDDIFDMRGVDRAGGCVVVVRPDQYVAEVLPLDAPQELARFFDGVFQTTMTPSPPA